MGHSAAKPLRGGTTHVFLARPDPQVWEKAAGLAAQGAIGWGLGRGSAVEAVERLKAAQIGDYFSIEYYTTSRSSTDGQWTRGILLRVKVPPGWTNFSTLWQLLNETGDETVEQLPGD